MCDVCCGLFNFSFCYDDVDFLIVDFDDYWSIYGDFVWVEEGDGEYVIVWIMGFNECGDYVSICVGIGWSEFGFYMNWRDECFNGVN